MPVRYNQAVKKPNIEIEWEPWMVEEMEKCMDDFFHFCQYVKVVHPDQGKVTYKPRWYQKELLQKILNNRYFVGLLSRQVGKSVSVGVYALWYSQFNANKVIGIVSNKENSAKDILKRIKGMYEELPFWLKCGVKEYNMTSVVFDNGTEIVVSATSDDAFRGKSINVLIADEFAFVNKNMAEEFWASNFPTLAASEESKIIIISTPNGLWNLFERIYTSATKDENGFVCCKYDWRVIPGRDEEWKRKQIKILGKTKFNQEHEVQFLGSTNTVIDSEVLERLFDKVKDPILYDLNDKLRIWEKPQKGQTYIIGNDVAKGTGEHYSTCQILKITSYKPFKAEQVAVYQDNYIDVYKFANLIYRLATYYNNAFVLVENNAEGASIVSELHWGLEYDNLVNEGNKSTQLGVRATTRTKPKAVLAMKKLIENWDVTIKDIFTINELTSFIDKGNNKFVGKDLTDDLVSGLYWACYITEFDVLDEDTEISTHGSDEEEEVWGILSDVEFPEDNFDWLNDVRI